MSVVTLVETLVSFFDSRRKEITGGYLMVGSHWTHWARSLLFSLKLFDKTFSNRVRTVAEFA